MIVVVVVVVIGEVLSVDMIFDVDVMIVDMFVLEVFQCCYGVCQDFLYIMIVCLCSIGVLVGYVSGFLWIILLKGQLCLEGVDVMYVWVMVWCGIEVGWIEYDLINVVCVGQDYIVVVKGCDYGDVVLVKGVLCIVGIQSMYYKVDVVFLIKGKCLVLNED